jgi:hypothetical protein
MNVVKGKKGKMFAVIDRRNGCWQSYKGWFSQIDQRKTSSSRLELDSLGQKVRSAAADSGQPVQTFSTVTHHSSSNRCKK